jgi:hypothetical protein
MDIKVYVIIQNLMRCEVHSVYNLWAPRTSAAQHSLTVNVIRDLYYESSTVCTRDLVGVQTPAN